MIPKIIHYCWLSGEKIPDILQRYMATWKEKLFDYEFILWNFDRFDINTSIWVKQTFEAKKYAFAADVIRLFAVYNYGGIYLDMDIEVIKSFNSLLYNKYMFAYENDDTKYLEAGCFGAEKRFWLLGDCLNYLKDKEYLSTNEEYTLPKLMKQIYNESMKEEMNFLSSDYFTAKSLVTGKITITKNTYCVHNFAASWFSEDERKYSKRKQFFTRIFGQKIATFLFFPMLVLLYFKKYGIIIGIKKILDKINKFIIKC